jgi:hypothetical protein
MYTREHVYTEEELGLSGLLDSLKSAGSTAWDWLKTGAKQQITGAPGAPPPPSGPPPAPTFMEQYGTLLLLGGAGLVLFLVLRRKKER